MLEQLSLLGFVGGSTLLLDQDHPQAMPLRGKELAFWCEHKPKQVQQGDQWVDTSEIREVWSIGHASGGGTAATPLEDKEQRQLDALFGKALNMNPGAVAQAKQVQAEQAAPEPTMENVDVAPAATQPPVVDMTVPEGEDDIPF